MSRGPYNFLFTWLKEKIGGGTDDDKNDDSKEYDNPAYSSPVHTPTLFFKKKVLINITTIFSIGDLMESLQKLFKTLDLTAFEAKLFIELLSHGPSSPSKLAEALGVHRPQVHASLKRLISKGLVEIYNGKPAKYRAVEPSILFDILSREVNELFKDSRVFVNNIPRKRQDTEYGIWLFKSSKGLMSRFLRAVSEAEVDLAVSGDVAFISRLRKKLIEAQERGVIVYVIVYEIPGVKFTGREIKGLLKAKRAVSGDLLVVSDSRVGILAQRRSEIRPLPNYGIAVEEPILIDYLLQDFFDRWLRSRSIIDEPINLPARYTMFKIGLIEVCRLLEQEKKLWGVFNGRWLRKKTDHGILEGEIIKAFYDPETGIAQIHVKSKNGKVYTAGGPDAIVEDFATSIFTVREEEK